MAHIASPSPSGLSTQKIASYAIQDPNHPEIEIAQVAHRIRLVEAWGISKGARVLEIGCGQGNCTTVLAEAVGHSGHIDALDPASADYGAPFTLAQAQAHISASEVGNRISWHQAELIDFLENNEGTWDFAVLSHCIWYFKSPSTFKTILEKLRQRVSKVCIAEYALSASGPTGIPHVLATFARATLEAHRDSSENIQSPLSPTGIKNIASETKYWTVDHETTITPASDLSDGRWEVNTVAHTSFLEEARKDIKDSRVDLLLSSMRDSVLTAIEGAGGRKNAHTMDVWVAVFSPEKVK